MPATPMMQQYQDAKAACPGALLLFRMGDFYELFFEDAQQAARTLGLALTSREKGPNAIPMAGFPYHQLDGYLAKLIAAGFRVAVCEQVEDSRQAKGLVRREVTRVVTAGTLTDDALMDPRRSNYLAAIAPGTPCGLAWIELSTGNFFAAAVSPERLCDELTRIEPAECLVADDGAPPPPGAEGRSLTRRAPWAFSERQALQKLQEHFGTIGLDGFGFDAADAPALRAAGAILDYLAETQKSTLVHIDRLLPYRFGRTLAIDEASRRSLEICQSLSGNRREGSLLDAMDGTTTPMGSRLLAEWLSSPLCDKPAIDERLGAVSELVDDPSATAALVEALSGVYDLARLLARVATGRASPRDLACIARTLRLLPRLKELLAACTSSRLCQLESELHDCPELSARLSASLVDDCPLAATDGGIIRPGFSQELDALAELATGGKQWIARYQSQEALATGISSLKVGFNGVFGYYLEVTHLNAEKVPPHYIRKQTVKNAERYITPELKEYEERVLTADEKAKELEHRLFLELRGAVEGYAAALRATAVALAEIDVLSSLAELARRRGYCRPEIMDEPVLEIQDGRHPVLDAIMEQGTLVPNDAVMDDDASRILLVTGPNMAGKSTFIRQVALLSIMAQAGSFVPARRARIGLADRVFARVGASDDLSRGRSTFMVEMTEAARILHGASRRSLVILDEIGRGTSTYDGLSLAWAIVEHLHDAIGCRTLFATHYQELTTLAERLAGVENLNVAVREWEDQVVFLQKIVAGAADRSYGIHVARLAGVPSPVIARAKEILSGLEDEAADGNGAAEHARRAPRKGNDEWQLSLFGPAEHPLLEALRGLDLDETSPIAAWQWLARQRAELGQTAGKPR